MDKYLESEIMKSMKKTMMLFAIFLIGIIAACSVHADTGSLKVTMLNQDPNPARASGTMNIRFQVENTGDFAASNIQLSIIDEYPFTVLDQDKTKTISSLSPHQTGNNAANIEFTVRIDKDANMNSYPLRMKYKDSSGVEIIKTYDIAITSQNYAQIIYLDKSRLEPGSETQLNFTINNVGNAPLQNMVFSWNEPTGAILPVYSDDTRYIKYLDVGQSVQLQYTVVADVNAKPGLYQLNLNLKYESTSNISTSIVNSKAGVFIGGQTDFDVAFSESTAGQTSLSVANTGNNPALSVSVRIPDQENYRVSGSNSAIIGNLDKGDYTLVSFQITPRNAGNFTRTGNFRNMINQTNRTGPGNNLQVIIEYTDTTGQRVSVDKSIPIQFRNNTGVAFGQTSAKSGFIGSTIFWILVIVIVAVAGYTYYRKKSRKKK
jgi:hypothetical protein